MIQVAAKCASEEANEVDLAKSANAGLDCKFCCKNRNTRMIKTASATMIILMMNVKVMIDDSYNVNKGSISDDGSDKFDIN